MYDIVANIPPAPKKNTKPKARPKKEIILPKIYINCAGEEEFAKLPGVSIITAKKIIRYRQENCSFKSKEEFLKVAKIKPAFIERIKKAIVLDEIANEVQKTEAKDETVDF